MILPIYTEPQPVLFKETERIAEITPEITQLIADMRETMHNAKGIGLAAPQIGQSVALCVIEAQDEEGNGIPFTALINPRITWKSKRSIEMMEACLSIPGVEGPVMRPDRVRVKATGADGKELEIKAGGLLARVLQHEIDHLHGKLFTSYVAKGRLGTWKQPSYPQV